MDGSRISIVVAAAAMIYAGGCASSKCCPTGIESPTSTIESADLSPLTSQAERAELVRGGEQFPSTGRPDPEALRQVIAGVRDLRVLDPASEAELLESLCQTPPNLWPLMVQQFRAAVAYRRQAEDAGTNLRSVPTVDRPSAGSSGMPAAPMAVAMQEDYACGTPMAWNDVPDDSLGRPVADHGFLGSSASTRLLPAVLPPMGDTAAVINSAENPAAQPHHRPPGDCTPPERSDSATGGAADAARTKEDWQQHVGEAVQALESQINPTAESSEDVAHYACLRMLYLLSGQREDALQPIPTSNPCVQDFWSKELYGLWALLDSEQQSGPTRRASEAKRHLSEAVARLGELSPLVVRNLAFVTAVQGYGTFEPFESYEFSPGQRVLLYAEVENFKSNQTAEGYYTSLRSSYQIFDAGGRLVAEHEFDTNEEYCRNGRRDFFIGYDFFLPERIYAGRHVLQLTVEDVNSSKIGQSSIEFTIKLAEK